MKICLLIGFQYALNGENPEKSPIKEETKKVFNDLHIDLRKLYLPSICIDLFQAYQFSRKMKPDRIIVITDILEDPPTKDIKDAIVKEIVDGNVLKFIQTIKNNNEHYSYSDLPEMLRTIGENIKGVHQLFFYYTGHAKNNFLILPNNLIHATEIKNHLLRCVSPSSQICLLFDCCFGININLPFRLQDKRYSLVSSSSSAFSRQSIICISSSSDNENAGLTDIGSIFTRIIFRLLNSSNRSIYHLISEINKQSKVLLAQNPQYILSQTSNVYSSHPDLFCLFSWLFQSDCGSIEIDPHKNILKIEPQILYCHDTIRM